MEHANENISDPLDETKQFQSRSAQRASVYLCYAPDDERDAGRICLSFERRGTPCWFSGRDLTEAMVWPQCIIEAIDSSKFFLLLLTANAVQSRDVFVELSDAVARDRTVIALQSADSIDNTELEALLKRGHVLSGSTPVTEDDINATWIKMVEIELDSEGDDDLANRGADSATAAAIARSFLVQFECIRGRLSGQISHQLGTGDRLVFGRGSEADVFVDDERASRRHAGLVVEHDPKYGLQLHLMDLMSRNGTWVRYQRDSDADISKFLQHDQIEIANGAIIRIGSTDIRVNAVPLPTTIASLGAE